ncbi:MAG TPA: hypothetical protein DCD97_03370 [Firmicutes bacterium]|jgi:hypothetical protein|nr:hypothetical protein [Bacillota bacterium]
MAETKYEKYIIKEPLYKSERTGMQVIHVCGEDDCAGAIFQDFPADITGTYISEPFIMTSEPHAHNYDQFLCFFGGNPLNFFEFDAEIELSLGEESEKHLIDTTSIVYIPKGLMHTPLEFKKVNKPVLFMHICFAPQYERVGGFSEEPPHRKLPKFSLEEIKS